MYSYLGGLAVIQFILVQYTQAQNVFMGVTWFKKKHIDDDALPETESYFSTKCSKKTDQPFKNSHVWYTDSMFPQLPVLNWPQITDPENTSRKKCQNFFKPFAQFNIVENVFLLFSEITVVIL